jgi:inorganic pyrophosphatase
MNLYKIPSHINSPDMVNAIIEIPQGTNVKYEYSSDLELFVADRTLCSAMTYPSNYGFIPNTLTDDGDALDILVFNSSPIHRGTLVETKVLGVLDMDDGDDKDWKIIGAPRSDLKKYELLDDIDKVFLEVCKNFFAHYKDIGDNKGTRVFNWHSAAKAREIISESIINK